MKIEDVSTQEDLNPPKPKARRVLELISTERDLLRLRRALEEFEDHAEGISFKSHEAIIEFRNLLEDACQW